MAEDAANLTRLYRVGPLPAEASVLLEHSQVSDWLKEATAATGQNDATGRWFTSSMKAALWYSREHPGYGLRRVDVPSDLADGWRASLHPSARRFSSQPQHEYFLPRHIADAAVEHVVSCDTKSL